ncbi:MAG: STAS domain-containing protein [Sulfuriferula sp.]
MPSLVNMHAVAAVLTLETATELLSAGFSALAQGITIFDFSAVNELDSAAIAFILACRREATRLGVSFKCLNLPENLKNLATLYGVENYLPI